MGIYTIFSIVAISTPFASHNAPRKHCLPRLPAHVHQPDGLIILYDARRRNDASSPTRKRQGTNYYLRCLDAIKTYTTHSLLARHNYAPDIFIRREPIIDVTSALRAHMTCRYFDELSPKAGSRSVPAYYPFSLKDGRCGHDVVKSAA